MKSTYNYVEARGHRPPSCDLRGLCIFLEVKTYKNYYSAVKSYFSIKKICQEIVSLQDIRSQKYVVC